VKRAPLFSIIGPGVLLAATGVGAGDLATGSIVGSYYGTTLLWAVIVGAWMKYIISEGVARWQLATGDTVLEGVVHKAGSWVIWLVLFYLILFSFFLGSALMGASGVALHALIPIFESSVQGKIVFGIAASLVGFCMVLIGGYRLFEYAMRACIAIMFITVLVTAAYLWPGTGNVLQGLLVPTIPDLNGSGLSWTLALIGGVGGSITLLCYGYWLREEGRESAEDMNICRIDLAVGYVVTGLFGAAMLIIGSSIEIQGTGSTLLVNLGDSLRDQLGPWGRGFFLVGAFGAIFSSLLGVWQALPYIFADCCRLVSEKYLPGKKVDVDTRALPYRAFLGYIATVPMIGLFRSFSEIQKIYTVAGALFLPFLALVLLLLNGRKDWVGELRNSRLMSASIVVILLFFVSMAYRTIF
jgi:Mn2+/Fe2+ NRAMP family transporter